MGAARSKEPVIAAAQSSVENRVVPVSPQGRQSPASLADRPIISQPHDRALIKRPVPRGSELDDELEALASEYMATQATMFQGNSSAHKLGVDCGNGMSSAPHPTSDGGGMAGHVEQKLSFKHPEDIASLAADTNAASLERIEVRAQPISWQRGQLLGAGSFGRVFFGLNMDTGELMAVKQINYTPGQPTDATRQAAQALLVEVRCLQSLSHPNIVRYLGVERDDIEGVISIMLEFCAGGSIASLLDKFGPFNEALTRSYLRMVLSGLHFLHTRPGGGILHRDVKGANVLVDSDGVCKLADFGASKLLQQDLMSTTEKCNSLRGTPYWMAPEVIRQTGHGRPADVWSLGCTMLEMLTAKPPWSHFSSQISALFHIASSKAPPPLPPNLSPVAASFLLRMLVRDPKERADTAELCDHPFLLSGEALPGNMRDGIGEVREKTKPFAQVVKQVACPQPVQHIQPPVTARELTAGHAPSVIAGHGAHASDDPRCRRHRGLWYTSTRTKCRRRPECSPRHSQPAPAQRSFPVPDPQHGRSVRTSSCTVYQRW